MNDTPKEVEAGQLDLVAQVPGDVVLARTSSKSSNLNLKGQDLLRAWRIVTGGYSRAQFAHVLLCVAPGVFIHADGKSVVVQSARQLEYLSEPKDILVLRHPELGESLELQSQFIRTCERYLKQKYGFAFGKGKRVALARVFVRDADARKFCSELVALLLAEANISVSDRSPDETLPTDIFQFCTRELWKDVTRDYFVDKSEIDTIQSLASIDSGGHGGGQPSFDEIRAMLSNSLPSLSDEELARAAWMSQNYSLEELLFSGPNTTLSRLADLRVSIAEQRYEVYSRAAVQVAVEALLVNAQLTLSRHVALQPATFPSDRGGWTEDLSDLTVFYSWLDESAWTKSFMSSVLTSRGWTGRPYDGFVSVDEIIDLELGAKRLKVIVRSLLVQTRLCLLLLPVLRPLQKLHEGYDSIRDGEFAVWHEGITPLDESTKTNRIHRLDEMNLEGFNTGDASTFRSVAQQIIELHAIYTLAFPGS